jgi:hypothetical protein
MDNRERAYYETLNDVDKEMADKLIGIRKDLLSKSYADMKALLSEFPDSSLMLFCDIFDPKHEDYEICQAVTEILKERGKL